MENKMKIEFAARAENEAFARSATAAFVSVLDPTIEELTEIKTGVSEAVSNSIIHGYHEDPSQTVILECEIRAGGKIILTVRDEGVGIEAVSYTHLDVYKRQILYVPVEQMDLVQKYIGADAGAPKLNKLSGSEWKTTKAKAKAAIANMAKELLEVSAARQMEEGYAFSPDTVWQKEFEDTFPYTETEDQLRCIEEIKQDMEKASAMDRLLCGDVGFGKTEVAARAVFKCAADGKQAAVLVPTTILANQHFYTLKERFEKFPFKVEMLSRFRSEAQQKAAIEGLAKGSVDVVIGTHRLLSKDVKFKDLGLLVIDEEQRFGVQHKEVIKQLKKNVDAVSYTHLDVYKRQV